MLYSSILNTRRGFLFYWLLACIGTVAVMPYALSLQNTTSLNWSSIAINLLVTFAFYAVAVIVGLRCARNRFNILVSAPMQSINWIPLLRTSITIGLGVGACIVLLDTFLFKPIVNPVLYQVHHQIPKWQGLMASLYGAVNEEVLMRLMLVSAICALLSKLFQNSDKVIWFSIVLVSIIFAAGHLPALFQIIDIPSVADISRVMVLNAFAGICFGYLYWKNSLETAVLAHFSADLVLHVIC